MIYSKVTEVFCLVDEFSKEYDLIVDKHLLGKPAKRPSVMFKSEEITITILFQLSGFRTFKNFIFIMSKNICNKSFPIRFHTIDL